MTSSVISSPLWAGRQCITATPSDAAQEVGSGSTRQIVVKFGTQSQDKTKQVIADVGPRDAHGEPLGGKTLARATVEWTFPIIEKARGALFYDTGFVNADAYDFSTSHIASDIGFGLRLDLPIGPLRVDYGIPIQKDGRSGSGKFNFNVGYQF